MYNIQFIVDKDENVYVLEVNPRSSRTVPFLSKITSVPMSHIATLCVLGHSLEEQGYPLDCVKEEEKRVFVKAPVFSFAKLRSVDTTLGPEMKSTGEALGRRCDAAQSTAQGTDRQRASRSRCKAMCSSL